MIDINLEVTWTLYIIVANRSSKNKEVYYSSPIRLSMVMYLPIFYIYNTQDIQQQTNFEIVVRWTARS